VNRSPINIFHRLTRWAVCLSLLSGVLAAAAATPQPDPNPTFTISRFLPGQPLHLVAYGDTRFTNPSVTSGTNPRIRKWLAERIALEHPAAVLLTGDTPYTGASVADWQNFQDETVSWRAGHILELPTTGNHEIYGDRQQGLANYLKNFPQIGGHLYYSVLMGNVEVISMDCTAMGWSVVLQSNWFAAQLDHLPRQVEFLLILYHVPWMADQQSHFFAGLPTKEAVRLRNILEARLPKLRAKVVVFNGHIHNYERFERRGVEYVVSGGGGADPYPLFFRGSADLYQDSAFPVYHYLTIEVHDHQLRAVMWKVRDPDAASLAVEQKDQFTLTASVRKPLPRAASARK